MPIIIDMTKQEAFDKAAEQIIRQGGPAKSHDGTCMYRTEDGRKCAVGALIPDDEYDGGLECQSAAALASIGRLEVVGEADAAFLQELQHTHDRLGARAPVAHIAEAFVDFAAAEGLKVPNVVQQALAVHNQ